MGIDIWKRDRLAYTWHPWACFGLGLGLCCGWNYDLVSWAVAFALLLACDGEHELKHKLKHKSQLEHEQQLEHQPKPKHKIGHHHKQTQFVVLLSNKWCCCQNSGAELTYAWTKQM